MRITDRKYFAPYRSSIGKELAELVRQFYFIGRKDDLDYQIQASAVYSSNIEGNSVNLNSFMNYKLSKNQDWFTWR